VLRIPGGKPAPEPGIPPFPGDAELGDRGSVVLAWQEALIAHGVIRDAAANRDQHYGKGMRNAVERLQRSWGWDDADGVAGKHTWSKLHGGP
jgi:peptidoglycan hydrolase-like protein with peptidoglycan-binding domain